MPINNNDSQVPPATPFVPGVRTPDQIAAATKLPPVGNTSGLGSGSEVPDAIKGWNWGAFGLNWIWGIGNNTFVALLVFLPIGNIVMPIVLGIKGNEWAWQNRHWDSIEHFKSVQRKWAYAWLMLAGIGIAIFLSLFFLSSKSAQHVHTQEQDFTIMKNLMDMSEKIALADTDTATPLIGCIGGGTSAAPTATNDASTCMGPSPVDFSSYKEASAAVTICTNTSTSPCQYMIARQDGAASNPTTENYEICSFLHGELMHIGSDTQGRVVNGCN